MKNPVIHIFPVLLFTMILTASSGQNVGINCPAPVGKLHLMGSADISQFIVDANSLQTNSNPLIKLRNANGVDLIWIHADDTTNTFVGLKSGRVNNVSGGGVKNTFIGKNAGYSNSIGNNNTALGMRALFLNKTGSSNTALGSEALFSNIGSNNTAVGKSALFANTTGSFNAAIGMQALWSNEAGAGNTAIGYWALKENDGNYNTAIGISTLIENTIGSQNTALGNEALLSNKAGSNATAIGCRAMYHANNTSSAYTNYNVAVGFEALYSGSNPSLNTGNNNTALGYQALRENITGNNNVATGYFALHDNTTGYYNAALGSEALADNTIGAFNTGIGYHALWNNTTGSDNSAFGERAYFITTGLNNTTCIGSLAGGIVNASNRIEIGNTSVTWIGGQVTWGTYSDARIKKNIESNVPGLEFINRLRPVTYNLNIHQQNEMVYAGKKEVGEWPEKYDIEKMRITGFIAQEVAQAAAETGYEFSGVDIPRDPNELQSIRYSDFVMPLVKAAQELSAGMNAQNEMINTLKGEVAYQKSENAKLTERLEKLEGLIMAASRGNE